MNIEALIEEVQERIDKLTDIESNIEDKVSKLEELRDTASETNGSLQTDIEVLQRISDELENADNVISDSENEGIE